MGNKRFCRFLLSLLGTILVLTGCGTTKVQQQPSNILIEPTTERHDLVFEVEISEKDKLDEIEATYKAKVVVWQADAGFAILAGSEGEHLAQQNILAESNIDAVAIPAIEGSVQGSGARP